MYPPFSWVHVQRALLRLSVFCVVLSAHVLRRLLGPSLDFQLEGERALDAVALHHPLAVAGVVRERRYLDLEYTEPPPRPEEVGIDRGPVVEHPLLPRVHAVHDPEGLDHAFEGEL